jgi:Spy/CpxP family protein refolding chaperone
MTQTERATWQNRRILAMLALVFLSGAAVGALGMRAGIHSASRHAAEPRLSYDVLNKELNLDPQQAAQLRSILDDLGKYNEDLQTELENVRTQIDDVRYTGKTRILQILNAAQRKQFEKICDQLPR